MRSDCPFCSIESLSVQYQDDLCFTLRDAHPVSRGHTLVIPRRHIASFFDATGTEWTAMMAALGAARDNLQREFAPDGYNIGINDGPAAGQTVPHLHIHLIPRYKGDCADPRGGIRWLLPGEAKYWAD